MNGNDVDSLIDSLQRVAQEAPEVPLVGEARIDRETVYDLLDQLRAILPEEEKQARWITKERDDLLREAKREAADIVTEARRRARDLTAPEVIRRETERAAQETIDRAAEEGRKMRLDAEDYADNLLASMQANLDKFVDATRRGRAQLHVPGDDQR